MRVPPRHPQWHHRPIPLSYHNPSLSFSSPTLVPPWGIKMITAIMINVGRCSNAQRWCSPGAGPPPPGSLPPVPGSGTPSPRPVRDVPYIPLSLRGPASLSRSKPDAVLLVPRELLWVSSARSSASPLRPFLCSSLRSLLTPRLARYAHHRYAVFYRHGLSSRRINSTMLQK